MNNKRQMIEALHQGSTEENLAAMTVEALKLGLRLDNGRHYLMGVQPGGLNVEDALEAFGFRRDGLGDAE